jgi:putative acetyltransferase
MTAEAFPKMALRPFLPDDGPLLADIFRESIAELTGDDYSEAQQEAWAAAADDERAFATKLAKVTTVVATLGGSPVGFAALVGTDAIDMLYVHPAVSRQGVGTMLLDALEKLAAGRGAGRLTVDASDSARTFFETRGYAPQRRNSVSRAGEWLANTTMQKTLEKASKP